MKTPLVSITSACYKVGDDVLDMVRSVLAQRFTEWELVLLDDGSPDNTYERLCSIGDPRVKVFRNEKNLGIPSSLNRLTELSQGKYIARMDSDDLAAADRIGRQVEFLESHPEVDVLGTGVIYLDPNNQPIGKSRLITAHEDICRNPTRGIRMAHPTLMARKTWFERFRYNEKIQRTSDYNLLLRAHEQSVYANLPDHLFYYRLGLSFNLKKEFRSRHYYWKTIADYYWPQKRYAVVGRAVLLTYLKYAYEVFHCLTGRMQQAYAHRYLPLSPEETAQHRQKIADIMAYSLPLGETALAPDDSNPPVDPAGCNGYSARERP